MGSFLKYLNNPHLLVFIPHVIPSPCMLTGPSDVLLMNGRWPKWWDITSMMRLQKAMTSGSSFSLLCWGSKLPCSEMLYGEASVWQPVRNWVLPATMWVSQKVDPSDDCTEWENPGPEDPGKSCLFSWPHRKGNTRNVCGNLLYSNK